MSTKLTLPMERLGRITDKEGKVTTHMDLVIYGRSKVGKTRWASTAPRPYIISVDPTGHKAVPYTIDGFVPKTLEEVKNAISYFYLEKHSYDTLILDGLTFLHDMFMREMGRQFFDENKSKDPDLLQFDQRMKILRQYKDLLRGCIGLTQLPDESRRVHVVSTTLEESLKEDPAAPYQVRPLFGTKSMNEDYPALFSTIAYIYAEAVDKDGKPVGVRKMICTAGISGILAGDRLDLLPSVGPALSLSDYLYSRGGKASE